ncbi:MAG TPA: hypothetical protein VGM56_06420 [Byssovorax sp.]
MSTGECTLDGVTVMKGNRVGVALSLAFSALCLGAIAFVIATMGPIHGKDGGAFLRVMIYGILGGGAGAYWFGRVARKASSVAGELRATASSVLVGDRRVVERRDIQAAYVWPGRGDGAYVRIDRRGAHGPVELHVKTADDARALVHALGFDATQSASEFPIVAPSRAQLRRRVYTVWAGVPLVLIGTAVGAAILAHGHPGAAFPVIFAGALAYAALILQVVKSGAVKIGADGIYVRWLWEKHFIPIGDVERAEVVDDEPGLLGRMPMVVRIHRRSGEQVDLVTQGGRSASGFGGRSRLHELMRMRAEIIAERVNEAVAGAAGAASRWNAAPLDRQGRDVDAWIAKLRALTSDVTSFRTNAPAAVDQLWAVVDDVACSAERRAAAAVALAPHVDDEGKARLRVVARATAAPKLRVALEAVADDDEADLAAALEELSAAVR